MTDEDNIRAHSQRGPSTAHRWRLCPGSVRKSEGLPATAGIDAAMGTVFHEHAANCVEFGLDPRDFVGDQIEVYPHGKITFDAEMARSMRAGLDFIDALRTPHSKVFVETRVSLRNWVGPEDFGTTDVGIVDPEAWRMVVLDWKYGAGVPVDPVENDQAILYALGLWDDIAGQLFYDWHISNSGPETDIYSIPDVEVWIVIEQPRAPGGGGVWKTTMQHLLRRGREIRADADRTLDPAAPLVPGEKQCRFCPAAKYNTCEARIRALTEHLGANFDDLDADFMASTPLQIVQARALSPEARSQLLLHRDMISDLLDELHKEAYDDAIKGRPTPGLKLVDGRLPPRRWKDEAKAAVVVKRKLGDAAVKTTLLSPTQVEEIVGSTVYEQAFEPFVDRGKSKPLLVPQTDKRAPLPTLRETFDDEDVI